MKRFWQCLLLIGTIGVLTSCGYSVKHNVHPFLTRKPIYVPVFNNYSDETGVEVVMTNALIRELRSRRQIVLTEYKKGALILQGQVTGASAGPSAFTDTGYEGLQNYRRLPSEYNVTLTISVNLSDPEKKANLWGGSFSGVRKVNAPINRGYDFQAPSAIGLITQSIIESVYADIARSVMNDMYDAMVEVR